MCGGVYTPPHILNKRKTKAKRRNKMDQEMPVVEKNKESKKYELPKPKLPDLEMPKSPKGAPITHTPADGDWYERIDYENSPIAPPAPGVPRIMVGLPILNFTFDFVQSFFKFWTQCISVEEPKYELGYYFAYRKPVHMADQIIAETALYNKCTHVLYIDDDITDINKDMLDTLLAVDKDVVSGVMYASKFPYQMCCFRRYDTNKKLIDQPSDNSMFRLYEVPCTCSNCGIDLPLWGIYYCSHCGAKQNNLMQKVDLIPFPFTLIKTDVFKRIKKPWFHCTDKYPADSWFADRCIEAGIQQWAHMGIRLTHNGVNDTTRQFRFNADLEIRKRKQKGIVGLDQTEMEKHQYLLHKRMKEAERKVKYDGAHFDTRAPKPKEKGNVSKKSNRNSSLQRKKSVCKKKTPGNKACK